MRPRRIKKVFFLYGSFSPSSWHRIDSDFFVVQDMVRKMKFCTLVATIEWSGTPKIPRSWTSSNRKWSVWGGSMFSAVLVGEQVIKSIQIFSCERYKLKDYVPNFGCYFQEVRDIENLSIVAPVISQCPSQIVGLSLW